jgi:transcriptional regulator with XRE-family HTH domain
MRRVIAANTNNFHAHKTRLGWSGFGGVSAGEFFGRRPGRGRGGAKKFIKKPVIEPESITRSLTMEMPEAVEQIGQRFAHLRQQYGLTQTEAAARLGISRSALSQIENGQTQPSFSTLRRAAAVYRVNYTYLMEGKGSSGSTDVAGQSERVIAVTVDETNEPNIVFVPVKAQAGYAHHRLEPQYLSKYPSFSLPGPAFRNESFRAFEAAGDSMAPTIHNGDTLICSYLSNWRHIWPDNLYVIVLQDDVLVKRMAGQSETSLRLASDNADYGTMELDYRDIVEIWKVYAKLTRVMSPPSKAHASASMQALVDLLRGTKSSGE